MRARSRALPETGSAKPWLEVRVKADEFVRVVAALAVLRRGKEAHCEFTAARLLPTASWRAIPGTREYTCTCARATADD